MEGGKTENSPPIEDSDETSSVADEMSFVMAEEEADSNQQNVMTQSKYAQVVFPEIADRYANDGDIICKFTYNISTPAVTTSDRIGLYRVPYFAPHEYISFQWVADARAPPAGTRARDSCFCLTFKNLPKDEDFYQFQYLRTDNGLESAIGASIPFQLQSPKAEELCTVEDDEEFMVVRSKSSFFTEQMAGQLGSLTSDNEGLKDKLKDYEMKHKKLIELSEKIQADLDAKAERCEILEKEQEKLEVLKRDLAKVLEDKLGLEERLHRHLKAIQTLQMDRDLMAGEKDQAMREKNLLLEERNQVMSKNEELKNMLHAATKAKDIAVSEVKAHILKSDEQQKYVALLEAKIAEVEALNKDLVLVNKDLIKAKETGSSPSSKLKELEQLNKNLVNVNHELIESKTSVIEQLKRKEKEFDLLKEEMVARSRSKFQEIDSLKKQLAEAERNLNKISELHSREVMTDVPESRQNSSIEAKLDEISKAVLDTRSEMRQLLTKSEMSSVASETDSLGSSFTTTESMKLLDQNMIDSEMEMTRKIRDLQTNEAKTAAASKSLWLPLDTPSPIRNKINDVIEGFKELEDGPQNHGGARPRPRPTASRDDSQLNSFCQFLPQITGSMFSVLKTPDAGDKMAAPLVPEVVGSPKEDSQFSDLVNWAKGSISSMVITDDGRILTEEEALLKCPICSEKFNKDQVKALELHVDAHLASNLQCPVCQEAFGVTDRKKYEEHVQGHFANEEEDEPIRSAWSFMDFD